MDPTVSYALRFSFPTEPARSFTGQQRKHETALAIAAPTESPEPRYLGAWRGSDGRWYLDVTLIVSDYALAMGHGIVNGQKCVFDYDAGQDLPVVYPLRRAA